MAYGTFIVAGRRLVCRGVAFVYREGSRERKEEY